VRTHPRCPAPSRPLLHGRRLSLTLPRERGTIWAIRRRDDRRASGSGSVGRASPCQGEGRGFESRLPLHGVSRASGSRSGFLHSGGNGGTADAAVLKTAGLSPVWVRIPLSAPLRFPMKKR